MTTWLINFWLTDTIVRVKFISKNTHVVYGGRDRQHQFLNCNVTFVLKFAAN